MKSNKFSLHDFQDSFKIMPLKLKQIKYNLNSIHYISPLLINLDYYHFIAD